MTRIIGMLIGLILLLGLTVVPASAQWGMKKSKDNSLSVFAAMDRKSDQSGFGAAFTKHGRETTDLAFVDMGDFRLIQASQLSRRFVGPYSVNFGFTAGYSDRREEMSTAPQGLITGVTAILGQTELSGGLSIDIRASSMGEGFSPTKWFIDPDVLWAGAGVSFRF